MSSPDLPTFRRLAEGGNLIALVQRVMSDQLTPVLAYRRLVAPDERTAPSFLLESVEGSMTVGRHSFLGSQPVLEVVARGNDVTVVDHAAGTTTTSREADPLAVPQRLAAQWAVVTDGPTGRPKASFCGGWVGFAGYDAVRFAEPAKLPFDAAPADDRQLPDLHFGLYRNVAVFDHVEKVLYAVCHVLVDEHESPDAAWEAGSGQLRDFVGRLMTHTKPLPAGPIDLDLRQLPAAPLSGNFDRSGFEAAAARCQEYIAAGDAFKSSSASASSAAARWTPSRSTGRCGSSTPAPT
ncbi:MAG: hypothetical protein ACYSUR_09685 [Planctomycetota bacterium]|jgi:anthranilate synthase component 1